MTQKVKPIPAGYHTITPYLCIQGTAKAIEFYKKAFGATELMRMDGPEGKIMHAEVKIGDSPFMLADEFPEMGFRSANSIGGTPIHLLLYVEDVDASVDRALKAGAELTRPVENQFYGDRSGAVRDPFGYTWHIATHIEDVSPEEMRRRSEKMAH